MAQQARLSLTPNQSPNQSQPNIDGLVGLHNPSQSRNRLRNLAMITPIVPQIFKVTASVNPYANVNVSTPVKNHRQTFFILADSGKLAQAKARLYMRENGVQCVTFCDGKEQPYSHATDALAFAKESGALNDARRLRDFIQRRNARPQNAVLTADEEHAVDPISIEFTKRYQELAASLGV